MMNEGIYSSKDIWKKLFDEALNIGATGKTEVRSSLLSKFPVGLTPPFILNSCFPLF